MKKIAFVIDYPDYQGGAHVATHALIERLRTDEYIADIVSPDIPNTGIRKQLFRIIKHSHFGWYPNWVIDPKCFIRKKLLTYDCVCCLGESSISRKLVSELPQYVRKVLLIHIDYCSWIKIDKSAREYCRFDKFWYPRYNCIGVVGIRNAEKMISLFPNMKKILPFHNIINIEKAKHYTTYEEIVHIISVIRVGDYQKRTDCYLDAADRLKKAGIIFEWSIYGGGNKLEEFRQKATARTLTDQVHFCGHTRDICSKLKEADIMVLLSAYEGLPNVIYESFLCGTPVFSTDVGAVSEQVKDEETGWLVPNEDSLIFEKLIDVISHKENIVKLQNNLSEYKYDNEQAYCEMRTLFGE